MIGKSSLTVTKNMYANTLHLTPGKAVPLVM